MISLKSGECPACLRSEYSINWAGVITLLLQCELHVRNDPIRRQVGVAIDRSVVCVVSGPVIALSRIPVAGVPVPPPAQHKHDARVVTPPPGAVMPAPVVIAKGDVG
jgi:hypothetical protein